MVIGREEHIHARGQRQPSLLPATSLSSSERLIRWSCMNACASETCPQLVAICRAIVSGDRSISRSHLMQYGVYGRAFNRASGIGFWQHSQLPNVPWFQCVRARSIWLSSRWSSSASRDDISPPAASNAKSALSPVASAALESSHLPVFFPGHPGAPIDSCAAVTTRFVGAWFLPSYSESAWSLNARTATAGYPRASCN